MYKPVPLIRISKEFKNSNEIYCWVQSDFAFLNIQETIRLQETNVGIVLAFIAYEEFTCRKFLVFFETDSINLSKSLDIILDIAESKGIKYLVFITNRATKIKQNLIQLKNLNRSNNFNFIAFEIKYSTECEVS